MTNAPLPDRRSENRAQPVPPETTRLAANVDAALEEQISTGRNDGRRRF